MEEDLNKLGEILGVISGSMSGRDEETTTPFTEVKMMSRRKSWKLVVGIAVMACLAALVFLDITHARRTASTRGKFSLESGFPSPPAGRTKVAIVRSDYKDLPHPRPVDDPNLTYQDIEDMVREAVRLSGGFGELIHSGDMVLVTLGSLIFG